MTTCSFCDQPAFSPENVKPPLCEGHMELKLVLLHLEAVKGAGKYTLGDVVSEVAARPNLSIKTGEVVGLLVQIERSGGKHGR